MRIFKDKELTQEIIELDLGIVEAGETKTFMFYVLNDSKANLHELKFSILHDEVKIIEAPKELSSYANDELTIEWNPSVTLKEGLKAQLRVEGKELWG